MGPFCHALLGALVYLEFPVAELLSTGYHHFYPADPFILAVIYFHSTFGNAAKNCPFRHQADLFKCLVQPFSLFFRGKLRIKIFNTNYCSSDHSHYSRFFPFDRIREFQGKTVSSEFYRDSRFLYWGRIDPGQQ
jgi:hypothetical protein